MDSSCRTNVESIFTIGDVTSNPMLAPRATHQAHVAAEVASAHVATLDTDLTPADAYTNPELAWGGMTQA